MNINEIFKPIVGYEGLYEVSNLGNVKSLNYWRTEQEKLLSPINTGRYLQVCLYKNGEVKRYNIHRLVAEAFISNPLNLPEVNHIDEDKTNNCVENLEWCDRQYNIDYSVSKQVAQYDLNGNLIKVWKSASEIEKSLGFLNGNISKCCRGEYKQSHGFFWQYV